MYKYETVVGETTFLTFLRVFWFTLGSTWSAVIFVSPIYFFGCLFDAFISPSTQWFWNFFF